MKRIAYFKVEMDPMADDDELAIKLSEMKGYKFFQHFPEDGFDIEQGKEWLFKIGLTDALYTSKYFEALGTINHRPADIKALVQKYLDRIITTRKLLIIDRYIFPNHHDSNYANFVGDILDKYLTTLDEITFITSDKHNVILKDSITSLLKSKNSTLNISFKFTEHFHDRFWISDYNDRGLFLGTSLNGYGKRYALIDYINTTDVRQIISELRGLNII